MKKTIIHVNRQMIAANIKRSNDDLLPVYTVKQGNKSTYAYSVKIHGPCTLVDVRNSRQLSCGARAWIETNSAVEIVGAMTYDELMNLKNN